MKKILLLITTIFCFVNLIHAQSDHPDSSFGTNGIVKTYLGKAFNYGAHAARQVLPSPDGGFYVIYQDEVYTNSYLSKRHADGSLDLGFGGAGQSANAGFTIWKAEIEPDGKIVAAGSVFHNNHFDFAVGRYNTNGSLDSSFSDDGTQTTDFGNSQSKSVYSVIIQKDKKILLQGTISDSDNVYVSFARYNSNGSPDSTFNNNGFFKTDIISNYAESAMQSDGKIVVAYSAGLLRLNADGSHDSTFITDPAMSPGTLYSPVIGNNGKITVLGDNGNTIHRFNSNGSTDNAFGNKGLVINNNFNFPYVQIALQKNGKIVALNRRDVTRYNTDGSPDSTFKNTDQTFFGVNTTAATLAIQTNGKILVGGRKIEVDSGYANDLVIARYNTVGKPDKTFDKDGFLIYGFHAGKTIYTSIITQHDGKIVTGGRTWNGKAFDYIIGRYNINGSIDKTFGNDGIVTTGILKGESINGQTISIAEQSDGKIVAAGGFSPERYNADGSLDKTFLIDTAANKAARYYINSIAIQKDGKILVNLADNFTEFIYFSVVRYNTDGTLDSTFGSNGKKKMETFPSSIALQNDGKIVVGCFQAIVRLNTDGSPDHTFDSDGKAYFPGGSNSSIAIQSDGKIIAAANGGSGFLLWRFNADGSLDDKFNNTSYSAAYKDEIFISAAIQPNGKIAVLAPSGLFRFYNNGNRDYSLDLSHKEKTDFELTDIAIVNDKLYASGGDYYGVVEKFLLYNNSSVPPTVTVTAPADNAYFIESANIKLSASASDIDGTISKVAFYNGDTLLHTEYVAPYGYQWKNIAAGNYVITARATDNDGQVGVSVPVHITVVSKNDFNVSMVSPVNNEVYAAPAYVHLRAEVNNPHGKIARVQFYNGSTLLRNEYKYPYTYVWKNVPEGVYNITAKATDVQGFVTTSETMTIKVIPRETIVSSKLYTENQKIDQNSALTLRLSPNPATNIVNVQTSGLQQNKPATISIISISGNVLKTVRISNSSTPLDVSTLPGGVYTIKIISGAKVNYKQFVKL